MSLRPRMSLPADSIPRFRMLTRALFFVIALILTGSSLELRAAEVHARSLQAWNHFVAQQEEALRSTPQAAAISPADKALLRNGEILVRPAHHQGTIAVPSALIHDWIGTIFIPGATLQSVLASVRSYEDYPDFYQPTVTQAKLISTSPPSDRYSVVMRQDVLTIRTGLAGEYVSQYYSIDPTHGYSVTHSRWLREIAQYGKTNQELLAPDTGKGFIWRIYSQTYYEQADSGVYLELEGAALSRTVPRALAWLVEPVIERISRSALSTTLRQTREAVLAPANGEQLSSSLSRRIDPARVLSAAR